jgi:uncharacterized membrane protein YqhA
VAGSFRVRNQGAIAVPRWWPAALVIGLVVAVALFAIVRFWPAACW